MFPSDVSSTCRFTDSVPRHFKVYRNAGSIRLIQQHTFEDAILFRTVKANY